MGKEGEEEKDSVMRGIGGVKKYVFVLKMSVEVLERGNLYHHLLPVYL